MRIAITGGIAEGKSTVLAEVRKAGVEALSADDVVKELWSDPAVLARIASLFDLGDQADRDSVRRAVAEKPRLRRDLNRLFHGPAMAVIRRSSAVAVEIPLLIETVTYGEFDQVWVVTCGPAEQLRRLTERLGSEDLAKQLIATQLPTRAKVAFADEVVRTDQPPSSVSHCVVGALRRLGLA